MMRLLIVQGLFLFIISCATLPKEQLTWSSVNLKGKTFFDLYSLSTYYFESDSICTISTRIGAGVVSYKIHSKNTIEFKWVEIPEDSLVCGYIGFNGERYFLKGKILSDKRIKIFEEIHTYDENEKVKRYEKFVEAYDDIYFESCNTPYGTIKWCPPGRLNKIEMIREQKKRK